MKFFSLLLFLLNLNAFAHPVIFQDGKESMTSYQPFLQEYNFMYSFNSKNSFGFKQMNTKDENMSLLTYNHLFKRFNGNDSQGNIYLLTGLGANDESRFSYNLGLEADWESRRLYVSGKVINMVHDNLLRLRTGFAPYKASFEDLNMWLMAEYTSFGKNSEITPFVRLYYDFFLIELGYGLNKNFMLNTMFHF